MIILSFVNKYDKDLSILGKSILDEIKGNYIKIYTRFKSNEFEYCDIKDTMNKIREYTTLFDKIAISFGLRIFPINAYKLLLEKYSNTDKNIVFLKKLKGSKTWNIENNKLKFDNYRISDSGFFILQSNTINKYNTDNFNTFLKLLIKNGELDYVFIPYWILTNRRIKNVTNNNK